MKKSLIILGLVSISFFACKEENKDKDKMNDSETEMNDSSEMNKNNTDMEMENEDEMSSSEMDNEASDMDLAEIAKNSDDLSTFVSAIEKAGMTVKIKGEGPFTVFAPTNEAFNKLPEGAVDGLMKPENTKKLEAALSYHIIPGNVTAEKLTELINSNENKKYELTTANDGKITATINKDNQVVLTDSKGDKAMITKADQKGKNGVIHSINSVLMRK